MLASWTVKSEYGLRKALSGCFSRIGLVEAIGLTGREHWSLKSKSDDLGKKVEPTMANDPCA